MKNRIAYSILIAASSIAFASVGRAEGIYDGIYSTNPNFGYATVREQQGTIVAVINQTIPDLSWIAVTGVLNGSSARLATAIGAVKITFDVTFTSSSTFQATQVSCTPDPGDTCLFPNGAQFTGRKIW